MTTIPEVSVSTPQTTARAGRRPHVPLQVVSVYLGTTPETERHQIAAVRLVLGR